MRCVATESITLEQKDMESTLLWCIPGRKMAADPLLGLGLVRLIGVAGSVSISASNGHGLKVPPPDRGTPCLLRVLGAAQFGSSSSPTWP